VGPVGEPPTAIWFLKLPPTSGKLVINLWFPVGVSPLGAVSQARSDYKVAIRRTGGQQTPGRAPEKAGPPAAEPVVTYDDSG
jgi:hypothetical protein